MSKENVEIVRRMFDAFPAVQDRLRRGELHIGEVFAEDVTWDASSLQLPDLGDGQLRGREGVRRFWMAWLSAWEEVTFTYELRDAGDQVVALMDQRMQGSDDIELRNGRYAQVWTFRDGVVVHWKVAWTPEECLAAAGLAE